MLPAEKYVQAWNERVSTATAHLDLSAFIRNGENELYKIYGRFVCQSLSLGKDDIVVDYGCGGAWLGRYLLNKNARLKKYIGLDISDRSVKFAIDNLGEDNKKVEIHKIDPYEYSLEEYKPSVIVSLSVIQHMPTVEVIENFLGKVNDSKARVAILQIRVADKLTFCEKPYKTTHEVNMANAIPIEFVTDKLTNYSLTDVNCEGQQAYLKFEVNQIDK